MKRPAFLILPALFLLILCPQARNEVYVSTSFREPANEGLRFIYSRDGLNWDSVQGTFLRPEVGREKVMRDPSIVKGPDGTFHLVWTSSWKGDRGFGYSSSKDLIHWSGERFIEVMKDTTAVQVWAPELFYDDVNRQFMIMWSSCVPGKFPDGQEERTNNHRIYYTTTKDFVTFADTKLLIDPGFSCIDATMVKRSDSDYVLIVKDNTRPERDIKAVFGKSPYGPWSSAGKPFTESFCEGPSTAKVGDYYYIYFDAYRKKIYEAVRTKDFITFQPETDRVKFPEGHKHGTVFMADDSIVSGIIRYNRDIVRYTGGDMAQPSRHDGGLSPVVGVHNIQIKRGEKGWTYNHQPMMAYWNGRFYVSYLTDPRSEHEAPGKTMLLTSDDGYRWSEPLTLFPEYDVPDGITKASLPGVASKNLKAVMHQRVGFYVSKSGRLIAMGNYGIVLTPKDDPNDGNGIGRVVREIKKDGSLSPVYFIYYNHGFGENNTSYKYYKRSKDRKFVKACDEILANPLYRMQWVEEADRDDSILPLKTPYKAFSYYTLPDGRVAGLWKHALTSLSVDGGNSWRQPVVRAPGFVNSNAKIWGQRLSDGLYATVYNPAEYRWPLAISLSADGLTYNTLNLINGEVTPERHGGNYKSFGPQYTRGILEGNGVPKDSDLWVTYSNNKEDIWVARIAVPVKLRSSSQAEEDFSSYSTLADMKEWNIYSPLKAPLSLDGGWLILSDSDPYDYARAERVIPATKKLRVSFLIKTSQTDHGQLNIEFADKKGDVCSSLVLDSAGVFKVKGGARYGTLMKDVQADSLYLVTACLNTATHSARYVITSPGRTWRKQIDRQFDTPVSWITRVVFRTGDNFEKPDIMTPADQYTDMARADETDRRASFAISDLKTVSEDNDAACALLRYDDYKHYAERFNTMEDENITTDIPNSQASEWMSKNIPLFDCPDKAMEEMYYYRWWSLRKHLVRTPEGYGMTEFLVKRSYADNYNLISCALGHHIMECRWIRDTATLKGIIDTWYFGNNGKPMNKLDKYSSWTPAAAYEAFKVSGDTAYMMTLKEAFEDQYRRWEESHRLPGGLYWQEDVKDGMEESISGGRKKRYARPTINSYMWGNATALKEICLMAGDIEGAVRYSLKADSIKALVEKYLWSGDFFETRQGDTLAGVREAIGYLPWYVGMIDTEKYDTVWKELSDDEGFSAPYGLTTAERRHPAFRSHGTGTCEWDGAIWPFATSQTLTALANHLNGGGGCKDAAALRDVFFREMRLYVESQHHRGRPYIGEYLDEENGAWLMGDRERSRYYNHSTFADLIITGISGLRPQSDGKVEVNPLIPEGEWDYFCLDGVNYHGHNITVLYDKTGAHYHQGKGLIILQDGKRI